MATTKNTTAKSNTTKKTTTAKKPAAKKTAKPKLEIVKDDPVKELSVFEKLAEKFPVYTTHVVLGDGIEVDVRNRISMGEMVLLVKQIVDLCVDEEHGEINFELYTYVTELLICAAFCGLEVPDNAEAGYLAVCKTGGMYEQIAGYIDEDQLSDIWKISGEKIKAKCDMFNSAAAKITVDMLQRINELFEMISSVTDKFDGEEAVNAVIELSKITGTKQQ